MEPEPDDTNTETETFEDPAEIDVRLTRRLWERTAREGSGRETLESVGPCENPFGTLILGRKRSFVRVDNFRLRCAASCTCPSAREEGLVFGEYDSPPTRFAQSLSLSLLLHERERELLLLQKTKPRERGKEREREDSRASSATQTDRVGDEKVRFGTFPSRQNLSAFWARRESPRRRRRSGARVVERAALRKRRYWQRVPESEVAVVSPASLGGLKSEEYLAVNPQGAGAAPKNENSGTPTGISVCPFFLLGAGDPRLFQNTVSIVFESVRARPSMAPTAGRNLPFGFVVFVFSNSHRGRFLSLRFGRWRVFLESHESARVRLSSRSSSSDSVSTHSQNSTRNSFNRVCRWGAILRRRLFFCRTADVSSALVRSVCGVSNRARDASLSRERDARIASIIPRDLFLGVFGRPPSGPPFGRIFELFFFERRHRHTATRSCLLCACGGALT